MAGVSVPGMSQARIIEVETERYGPLKMQSSFPKFSATPGTVRRPAPVRVGQHNAEIYGELLGLDDAGFRKLFAGSPIKRSTSVGRK